VLGVHGVEEAPEGVDDGLFVLAGLHLGPAPLDLPAGVVNGEQDGLTARGQARGAVHAPGKVLGHWISDLRVQRVE
jgi:hypothetical protein